MNLKRIWAHLTEGGPVLFATIIGILFGLGVYWTDYSSIEATTINLRFKLRNRFQPWPKKPENILYINISDAALIQNRGGKYGTPRRWPWPRSNYAEIHRLLKKAGIQPAAVVYDIVFDLADDSPAEPPRGYSFSGDQSMEQERTNDQFFQESIAADDVPVFLAALFIPQSRTPFDREDYRRAFADKADLTWFPPPRKFQSFGIVYEPVIHDPVYHAKIVNHPWDTEWWMNVSGQDIAEFEFMGLVSSLVEPASGSGMTTIDPEEDGIIRSAPLVVEYDGLLYPSLPLQVVLNQWGVPFDQVRFEPHFLVIPREERSDIRIPVDEFKRLILNFRFDWGETEKGFGVLDYWVLIDGLDWLVHEEELERTGRHRTQIPDLNDKILIVGSSATATSDIKATPISKTFPGMGTIGTIVRSIQQEDFLREVPAWVNALLAFGVCLVVGVFGTFMPPIRHAFGTALLGGVYSILTYFVFVQGYIINFFHVTIGGIIAYAIVTISQYLKVSNLFGRYITPEVRRYLMSNRDALELGGQETEVSILFSDLKGFTSMSEKLEAKQVISALNEYFGPMFKIIIDEEHGTLDKLIGDAIMAYFGHPRPNSDHPAQAVRAALKMQQRLEELREEWEKEGKPLVRMRIGVNTGTVVAGNMGDAGRTDYSIIGDNVNLASRLESNAPVDGVLISDTTYERVKDLFIFKERDPIMVKGKEKPIKVYEVLDRKETGPNEEKTSATSGQT